MSEQFKHVKGFDALGKALTELPTKIAKNVMRSGLRAGAVVFKEEAELQLESNGSVKTGELKRGLKVGTNFKNGVARATLKVTGKHAFIAPWLEFGTAAHSIAPKNAKFLSFGGLFAGAVEHPGARPKPFLRPALDGKSEAALMAVGNQVKARLTKQGIDTPDISIDEETP